MVLRRDLCRGEGTISVHISDLKDINYELTPFSLAAILSLVARFKAVRESQGMTLTEVAERMGIDPPALSRLETGKMLNPTLATLHKWAEALGQKLHLANDRVAAAGDAGHRVARAGPHVPTAR